MLPPDGKPGNYNHISNAAAAAAAWNGFIHLFCRREDLDKETLYLPNLEHVFVINLH